ncbi:MAG: hypothetical protein ACOWWH_13925, partial [Eubacteriaceae bacterium]
QVGKFSCSFLGTFRLTFITISNTLTLTPIVRTQREPKLSELAMLRQPIILNGSLLLLLN